jgi:sodium-dependent dicarboxylate transporter 2/3/5
VVGSIRIDLGATAAACEVETGKRSPISMKQLTLYLGPILFALCLLIPSSPAILDAARGSGAAFPEGPKFGLGVLLWTAVWWIGETVPLGLAALVPPALFGFSGIVTWKDGLASFMDPLIWVVVVGFLFARAFQVWGLDKRVALGLASLSRTTNPMLAGFFVASLPVFLLTVTGSMTASTCIVYGFVLSFLGRLGFKRGSPYGTATLIALGQAAMSGALVFLTSTTTNLIAKKVIAETTGFNLTFVDWFVVGTAHALLGLVMTWLVVYLVVKPETRALPLDPSTLRNELHALGSMGKGEKLTILLLVTALALWLLPGLLVIAASLYPSLAPTSSTLSLLIPEAAPSVLVILLMPILRANGRPLLRWGEILSEAINWDVVFLVGGGITLGVGLISSGFAQWVGTLFRGLVGASPSEWTIFAISSLVGFLLSYPASNTGAASMACPLAATLAAATGFNPIPPILGAAIATTIPSSLPSTTPAIAIVYSSGYVRMRDLFRVGIVCDVIRFALLLIIGFPLAQYFLSLKGL